MKRTTQLKGKTQKLLTALTSTILRCKAFRNQLWCFIIFLRFHTLFKKGKIILSKKIFVHFSITQYTKNQDVSAENVSIYLLFKSLSYKTFPFPLCICYTGIKYISPVKQFMGICIYPPELHRARSNFGKSSFRSHFPEYTNALVLVLRWCQCWKFERFIVKYFSLLNTALICIICCLFLTNSNPVIKWCCIFGSTIENPLLLSLLLFILRAERGSGFFSPNPDIVVKYWNCLPGEVVESPSL